MYLSNDSRFLYEGKPIKRAYDGLLLDAGGTLLQLSKPVHETYASLGQKYGHFLTLVDLYKKTNFRCSQGVFFYMLVQVSKLLQLRLSKVSRELLLLLGLRNCVTRSLE